MHRRTISTILCSENSEVAPLRETLQSGFSFGLLKQICSAFVASKTANDSLLLSAQWGGGKDAVHGTVLQGQRHLGRRGGVGEDLDKKIWQRGRREARGERLPLVGRKGGRGGEGGAAVSSARSLAVGGARRSPEVSPAFVFINNSIHAPVA